MGEPRPEKAATVEDLERRLRASEVVILTDYRGLTVDEIGALRGRLRDAKLEYRVAKNTLLALAAERCGRGDLSKFLTGPTAVVFGQDDPGLPSRLLQEFIRQYRKLEIKGGLVSGQALGSEEVRALASLPSRLELLARVLGMIQAPLASLASVLNAPARGLVTALDAVRKQRQASGADAAPETSDAGSQAAAAPPAAADAAPVAANAAPRESASGAAADGAVGTPAPETPAPATEKSE
jgi:large subunit ribosomal protein L10